jgi:DNA-binding transcriptional MerR regulator
MVPHMKELTVNQLAVISGITVRTLHHYDEIGLLRPATVGANGYRYYGRTELLRLQRILFHRELGVPLAAIAELLEMEGADQAGVLRQHRAKLVAERERYRVLIDTIDNTIRELAGETHMSNADLYQGFSAEKQAQYEAWLIQKYGEPMREDVARSKQAWAKLPAAEQEALGREYAAVEQALAGALRHAVDPAGDGVAALIRRHRAWVAAMWGKPCNAQAYAGLADLYLSHPDFVDRYERIEKGFAQYLARAMKLHAAREP